MEGGDGRFPHLEFENSDTLEVGDMVLAIGNPFGVGQTVTSGIISALARTEIAKSAAQVFIQTDAAINPGNSGGALVDMAGRVVGINTAIFSRSGGSHGIGFAIPSNLVKLYVDSAVTGRKIERPWLGAKLDAVTRELAEALGLDRVGGRGGDAALCQGSGGRGRDRGRRRDRGDRRLRGDRPAHRAVPADHEGRRATARGSTSCARASARRVDITLRPAPGPGRDDVRNLAGQHPFDGARVSNILPGVTDELGIEEEDGVVVLSVRAGSTAGRLGFKQGDVIVQIGRQKIATIGELEGALKDKPRVWQIVVKRGAQSLQLQIPG